jgi:hypothetical protein
MNKRNGKKKDPGMCEERESILNGKSKERKEERMSLSLSSINAIVVQ